jgi:hypothetical protein
VKEGECISDVHNEATMVLLTEGNKLQSWGYPLWNHVHTHFHQIGEKYTHPHAANCLSLEGKAG